MHRFTTDSGKEGCHRELLKDKLIYWKDRLIYRFIPSGWICSPDRLDNCSKNKEFA